MVAPRRAAFVRRDAGLIAGMYSCCCDAYGAACGRCAPVTALDRASPDAAIHGHAENVCRYPSLGGHRRMLRCPQACGAYGMLSLTAVSIGAACGRCVPRHYTGQGIAGCRGACGHAGLITGCRHCCRDVCRWRPVEGVVPPSLPGRASPDAAVAVGMRDLSRDAGTVAAEPACGRHVLLPLRWAGHPRQPPLLQMGIKCPLWGMPYCARPCIGLFAFRAACARPRTGVPPSLPALPKARPCGGMAASYCQQDRFPAPLHPLAVQWQANTLLRPAGNLNPAATKKATL